uniref:Uncharacterized protein n=1 Tax=Arundo donax TaxID=35708 RepID=A0A0A9H7J0_ARUDO
MEDLVDAAATAINYIGESVLQSRARGLVALAVEVEVAANAARVDRSELTRAAGALNQVHSDNARRVRAVLDLCNAATALEKAASAPLHTLRSAAARLASACREYQEAANAMAKVSHAKAGLAQQERRVSCAWWSSLWVWGRAHRGAGDLRNRLLDEEDPPPATGGQQAIEDVAHAAVLAMDFLGESGLELRDRADKIVVLAYEIMVAANAVGVPHDELAAATEALEHTDNASRLGAVINLGLASTTLERADSAELSALCGKAAHLARACQHHREAADAMAAVRHAAAERLQQRVAGTWWWRRPRRPAGGLEHDPPPADKNEPVAETGPGEQLGQVLERMAGMHGCAIFASVALLPYLGSDGVFKNTDAFSDDYRWTVCKIFSSCWGLVGLGMSCSSSHCRYQRVYARLSSRLGMLGVTIFVIYFCHWLLDPTGSPNLLVFLAVLFHVVLFIRSCIVQDM